MKKLVLAIGLVIASSVNVFGQNNIASLNNDISYLFDTSDIYFRAPFIMNFLKKYDIEIKIHELTNKTIIVNEKYLKHKVLNQGGDQSFISVEHELTQFKNVKITGHQTFDISDKSYALKTIELIEYLPADGAPNVYALYILIQDKHGKWYSETDLILNTFNN